MKIFTTLVLALFLSIFSTSYAGRVVNVYVWGGEIPSSVIKQFEKKTGITVRFSTYDSNETMYAKLKATNKNIYDVIMPSAYYVERMKKQDLLMPISKQDVPNKENIEELFINNDYDPGNKFSVPVLWGATGIFYNQKHISYPASWKTLWQPRWKNQLLLLEDSREVFSIALMSLGFSPNDTDPDHIRLAYEHLLELAPNIKLFSSDNIQSILIDEDANLGTVWNGDAYKAHNENNNIKFVYPQEGFVIWVDCLAIPKNPPHIQEAYEFINFILTESAGVTIGTQSGYGLTNAHAKKLLPSNIINNTTIYPPKDIMKRGNFQRDVGEKTVALYNQYWQRLKFSL